MVLYALFSSLSLLSEQLYISHTYSDGEADVQGAQCLKIAESFIS